MKLLFIIVTTLFMLVIQTEAQFDCSYDCTRGSCDPLYGEDIHLRCDEWMVCGPGGPCTNEWQWNCQPNYPYTGTIKQCNRSGCIPPWGCTLVSFEKSTNTCQNFNTFCDKNPNKECCKNDENCDKYMHPCTPPTTLQMNTTSTTTMTISPTEPPKDNNQIIIGVSVAIGTLVLLFGLTFLILWGVRRRRKYTPLVN